MKNTFLRKIRIFFCGEKSTHIKMNMNINMNMNSNNMKKRKNFASNNNNTFYKKPKIYHQPHHYELQQPQHQQQRMPFTPLGNNSHSHNNNHHHHQQQPHNNPFQFIKNHFNKLTINTTNFTFKEHVTYLCNKQNKKNNYKIEFHQYPLLQDCQECQGHGLIKTNHLIEGEEEGEIVGKVRCCESNCGFNFVYTTNKQFSNRFNCNCNNCRKHFNVFCGAGLCNNCICRICGLQKAYCNSELCLKKKEKKKKKEEPIIIKEKQEEEEDNDNDNENRSPLHYTSDEENSDYEYRSNNKNNHYESDYE